GRPCSSTWWHWPLVFRPCHHRLLLIGEVVLHTPLEARVLSYRADQLRPGEVASLERRPAEVRAWQHRPDELAPLEAGRPHVAPRQIGASEVAVLEVVPTHPRLG